MHLTGLSLLYFGAYRFPTLNQLLEKYIHFIQADHFSALQCLFSNIRKRTYKIQLLFEIVYFVYKKKSKL